MKTRFDIWVDKMIAEFPNSKRYSMVYTIVSKPDITFCYDKRTGKIGMARCHPDDKPDYRIGKAIAYARCRGYEVPRQTSLKYLHDMKNGDKFYYFGEKIAVYIGVYVDSGCVHHVAFCNGVLCTLVDREFEVIE